jgi:lipid-binding SYLF domain-containing protein
MLRTAMTVICLMVGLAAPSYAADNQGVIDRATGTVTDMRHDASFGNSIDILHRAKAVMIVPQLVKGGFIFGAEGGKGVLLARGPGGDWSDPAFFGIGSGSFGLQIGLEEAELVMFVMSDKALHAILHNSVKLGVGAGLTVLVVGSGAEADATTHGDVDVIAWSKAKGAYGGITLSGSVIKPLHGDNDHYYGHVIPTSQIIHTFGHAPGAHELRAALRTDSGYSAGRSEIHSGGAAPPPQ